MNIKPKQAGIKNPYLITALLCLAAFIVNCIPMENAFSKDKVLFSLALLFTYFALILYYTVKKTAVNFEDIAFLIITGAFVIRLIYVWATPYNVSPHDLGTISQTPELTNGHLGYAGFIYHNGKLPDMNPVTVWGFYNPPLNAILNAAWLKINTLLHVDWDLALENLQFLSLLSVTWANIGVDRLLKEFQVRGVSRLVILGFISFFPAFIWFSGAVNSDPLVLFWMVHILLFTVRWYKKRDVKTIVLLALCIGLGMLTKINVGLLAIGTAFIFLWVFIREVRREHTLALKYIKQFLLFGVICIPIGLYWPLRCYFLFDMPLTFVPDPQAATLYLGDKSFWELWGIPSGLQLGHSQTQIDLQKDSNVWMNLIRTALYDEQTIIQFPTASADFAARILLYMQFPLILFMNGCYALTLFGKKCKMALPFRILTGIVYLALLVSFISLFCKLPYICTANFRYIPLTFVIPCLGTAVFFRNRTKTRLFKIFCVYAGIASALSVILFLRYCFL